MTVSLAPEWIDSEATPGTKWKIRSLTGLEHLEVGSTIPVAASGTTISAKTATAYLVGLVGWDGAINPETKQPLPFNRENLRFLSAAEISEIITEIQARSNLSADAEKN